MKIRTNPAARTTDLPKTAFGKWPRPFSRLARGRELRTGRLGPGKRAEAMNRKAIANSLAAAVFLATSGFAQGVPGALKKLQGTSDDVASDTLARLGYRVRNDKATGDRASSFWWNDASRQCVRVASRKRVVVQVAAASTADCGVREASGGSYGGGARDINAADLQGLTRSAAEARLNQAGFQAQNIDQSKGDVTYMWWFNGRQCLAVTLANERYELVHSMPSSQCR
jgi:hypothetical protein